MLLGLQSVYPPRYTNYIVGVSEGRTATDNVDSSSSVSSQLVASINEAIELTNDLSLADFNFIYTLLEFNNATDNSSLFFILKSFSIARTYVVRAD